MNGKERLFWAENAQGYVYLTSLEAPVRPGFVKHSTVTPSEMDRIWAKMSNQETKRYGEMTRQMYEREKDFNETNLSNLRQRLSSVTASEQEKDIIRCWIQAFNNRMDRLTKNSVYGLAEMQAKEAPLDAPRREISVEEIHREKQTEAVIIHDLDKPVFIDLRSVKPESELIQ